MLPEIVGSTIRTLLASAGGYLVAKGYIGAEDVETIAGVVIGVLTLGWSIWQKKKAKGSNVTPQV